jgi:hypothetical protein
MLSQEDRVTGSVGPFWKATFLSLPQAQRQSLSPSTAWESPSPGTLRYLARQRHRAETQLHLETAIVQDERGWVALWTRERSGARWGQTEPPSDGCQIMPIL